MITHIVNKDKFTEGYIKFMIKSMGKWQHCFLVLEDKDIIGLKDDERVIQLSSWNETAYGKIKKILSNSEKIIITGAFFVHKFNFLWTNSIWNKVYIQFWGGDFYELRNKSKSPLSKFKKWATLSAFRKSKGLVFLIEGEYEKFKEITRIEKLNFVAPMTEDPNDTLKYKKYWLKSEPKKSRIIVGNSATSSNHHYEVFDKLIKYSKEVEDFEVLCPLSYGDDKYRDEVIKYGKQIFGKKFKPITHLMSMAEYAKILSECTVGIYNNDRQQGMGNISLMLYFGNKVFISPQTSMFSVYKARGYEIYPISMIDEMDFKSFFLISEKDSEKNHRIGEKRLLQIEAKEQWASIFSN